MTVLWSYVLIFAIAFSVTYLITPSVRFFGLKFSVIDRKDERKIHDKVITRFGGIAIYVGFIFAMICSFFLNFGLGFQELAPLMKVFIAATLVLCLGFYDDVKGANVKIKLFVQTLAAFFLINSGFLVERISNPLGGVIELGILSIPITILWLVGITNAINLIDGMDGLAGGIVFISSAGLSIVFIMTHRLLIPAFSAIALAGAVLAFLRYNFNPAKIFMGDTGSMFLGFTIAAIAIMSSHKAATSISLLIPIIALGVPIADTTLAFLRRFINKQNIFAPDQKHIHHWLMGKNLTSKQVVVILLGITVLLNIIAVLLASFR